MPPDFKPFKQLRVSEGISEQIKQSILLGKFKPGDKLPPERELAEQFQVSRVAVREALRILELSGFIVTRQGITGGAFVTDLSFDHLIGAFLDLFKAGKISIPDMNQVRVLVEPEVARLAAQRVTPEWAEELRKNIRSQDMHFILAKMCGNSFFEAIVSSTMRLTKQFVEAVGVEYHHPGGSHQSIVDAVTNGDANGAAEIMHKHAIENGKVLSRIEEHYRRKKLTAPI
jgi:GntR family transcriptional repressor for pyruvate dehydrogenase complex